METKKWTQLWLEYHKAYEGDGAWTIALEGFSDSQVVVANAIIYLGATPIYADIDLDTYNLNLESLQEKITERMNTASEQLKCAELYDHVVINDEVCRAADEILDIINSEKKRGN